MYNIESLAELSGLTKRTVRYYIQLGLLTPPIGSCRGSYYTESHLQRLDQIKRLSSQGVPLTQMKAIISSEISKPSITCEDIRISKWTRAIIGNEVELSFRQDFFTKNELDRISDFISTLLHSRDNN
ncbi:MAG: MerR family transcriptional regulator [Candidatus Sericytochromatia bacterium]